MSAIVTYDVASGELHVDGPQGAETRRESIFDYLDRELRRLGTVGDELPFDLTCGFVGYFGYGLKAASTAASRIAPRSLTHPSSSRTAWWRSTTPSRRPTSCA